jgi:peroxiredoxin
MAKPNEENLTSWTEQNLARLAPDGKFEPDVARAIARFEEKRHTRARRQVYVAAFAAMTALIVATLPKSRETIRRSLSSSEIVDIGQVSADVKTLRDGQVAPDFVLKDAQGDDLRLSDYKGRVVLLNFWATWCHGCAIEIPWLIEFEKEYRDRGLTVIGVSMDEDGWKSVKPFLEEEKVNYPVVIGNQPMAKPYGLGAMPMTFLINRDGKIAATSVGIIDRAACRRQILELLASSRH